MFIGSITIAEPGSENGPCAEECQHLACVEERRIAAMKCKYCSQPLGYGRVLRVYNGSPAHKDCAYRMIGAKAP